DGFFYAIQFTNGCKIINLANNFFYTPNFQWRRFIRFSSKFFYDIIHIRLIQAIFSKAAYPVLFLVL
ncbi:hypothetical protein HZS_5857, partial [Henneguya salminicola]